MDVAAEVLAASGSRRVGRPLGALDRGPAVGASGSPRPSWPTPSPRPLPSSTRRRAPSGSSCRTPARRGRRAAGAPPGCPADPDRPGPVVLPPEGAKGLEFDSVLVVDPAGIVAEGVRGHNDLYVALTRATQRLGVVHPGEPAARELGPGSEQRGPEARRRAGLPLTLPGSAAAPGAAGAAAARGGPGGRAPAAPRRPAGRRRRRAAARRGRRRPARRRRGDVGRPVPALGDAGGDEQAGDQHRPHQQRLPTAAGGAAAGEQRRRADQQEQHGTPTSSTRAAATPETTATTRAAAPPATAATPRLRARAATAAPWRRPRRRAGALARGRRGTARARPSSSRAPPASQSDRGDGDGDHADAQGEPLGPRPPGHLGGRRPGAVRQDAGSSARHGPSVPHRRGTAPAGTATRACATLSADRRPPIEGAVHERTGSGPFGDGQRPRRRRRATGSSTWPASG